MSNPFVVISNHGLVDPDPHVTRKLESLVELSVGERGT